jgi:hypothetical protein
MHLMFRFDHLILMIPFSSIPDDLKIHLHHLIDDPDVHLDSTFLMFRLILMIQHLSILTILMIHLPHPDDQKSGAVDPEIHLHHLIPDDPDHCTII